MFKDAVIALGGGRAAEVDADHSINRLGECRMAGRHIYIEEEGTDQRTRALDSPPRGALDQPQMEIAGEPVRENIRFALQELDVMEQPDHLSFQEPHPLLHEGRSEEHTSELQSPMYLV